MKRIFILVVGFAASFVVSAQDIAIDQRAKLHYSPNDLKTIQKEDPGKIPVLNFYYQNSYVIVKPSARRASKIDLSGFDVTPYEHLRQEEQRTRIDLKEYGCSIELISLRELEAAYTKLPTR